MSVAWPRPYWRDSGAQAFVQWFVFGDFEDELHVDAPRYRTRGTPAGVEVARYVHDAIRGWNGYPLGGSMGTLFGNEDAALFARASRARECLMLRGSLADPPDLDYLRDLVGTITGLVDLGGVAVCDPQMLSLFGPIEWSNRFFSGGGFDARNHVAILSHDDENARSRLHIHTRGLRKFARPDISIRNVPAPLAGHAGQLAQRFVEFQALGGIVEEGREIAVEGLPQKIHARHGGTLEDPRFANVHVEMRWPD